MKKKFAVKRIIKLICLLMTVGILCIIPQTDALASEVDSALTGQTEERTNIDEPGSADSREDLSELNIANNLTITQSGGNGQDFADTAYVDINWVGANAADYVDILYQNHYCASFYQNSFKHPNGTA